MGKHKYHYLGDVTVNLPTHRLLANGGDSTTVYTTDEPINHPDFHEIKPEKRKERSSD